MIEFTCKDIRSRAFSLIGDLWSPIQLVYVYLDFLFLCDLVLVGFESLRISSKLLSSSLCTFVILPHSLLYWSWVCSKVLISTIPFDYLSLLNFFWDFYLFFISRIWMFCLHLCIMWPKGPRRLEKDLGFSWD